MREAGRKALMPMLPDTLGTKSFFRPGLKGLGCRHGAWHNPESLMKSDPGSRTVSQLKVPEGPQKAAVVAQFGA